MAVVRLSPAETLAVVADVLAPLLARGIIVRRRRVVGLVERFDADRRAVKRLQALRARHGDGPVVANLAGRKVALVLGGDDARTVLEQTPEPYAAATREKRAALRHFQPHGVLVTHGPERAERRAFNEAVLDTGCPVHGLADALVPKVEEEARALAQDASAAGALTYPTFERAFWRIVRRVVLGDAARDDDALTDGLTALRRDANWAFLKPRRDGLRERFTARLHEHLARAEPGSLAARIAAVPATPRTDKDGQVPQWLFAFDAAAMASFRTLALLSAHPEAAQRARAEADAERPFLRACVLEALRLWPTTPAILRETTTAVAGLPAGAEVVVHAPFLHRDDERLDVADRFAPEVWLDGDPNAFPLVPFSHGPARCPGRELVLLTTATLLHVLLDELDLEGGDLSPGRLPASLSPFGLRFVVIQRPADSAPSDVARPTA